MPLLMAAIAFSTAAILASASALASAYAAASFSRMAVD